MRFAEKLFVELLALSRHQEIEQGEEAAVEGAQAPAEALPPAAPGGWRRGVGEQEGELEIGEEGQAGSSRRLRLSGDAVEPGAQGREFGEAGRGSRRCRGGVEEFAEERRGALGAQRLQQAVASGKALQAFSHGRRDDQARSGDAGGVFFQQVEEDAAAAADAEDHRPAEAEVVEEGDGIVGEVVDRGFAALGEAAQVGEDDPEAGLDQSGKALVGDGAVVRAVMDEDDGRPGALLFKVEGDVMVSSFHRFLLDDVALPGSTAIDIPRFYNSSGYFKVS